jgi:hypothetical protein
VPLLLAGGPERAKPPVPQKALNWQKTALVLTYYPESRDEAGATPVSLRAGEIRTGVVVRLIRLPLFSAKVRIRPRVEVPHSWVADLLLINASTTGAVRAYPPEIDDEMTIYGLIPGTYSVQATVAERDFTNWPIATDGLSTPFPPHHTGRGQFTVTNHDVQGIEIEVANQ